MDQIPYSEGLRHCYVIGDGTLEVPVPDMSRETIYDDERQAATAAGAHSKKGEGKGGVKGLGMGGG